MLYDPSQNTFGFKGYIIFAFLAPPLSFGVDSPLRYFDTAAIMNGMIFATLNILFHIVWKSASAESWLLCLLHGKVKCKRRRKISGVFKCCAATFPLFFLLPLSHTLRPLFRRGDISKGLKGRLKRTRFYPKVKLFAFRFRERRFKAQKHTYKYTFETSLQSF